MNLESADHSNAPEVLHVPDVAIRVSVPPLIGFTLSPVSTWKAILVPSGENAGPTPFATNLGSPQPVTERLTTKTESG